MEEIISAPLGMMEVSPKNLRTIDTESLGIQYQPSPWTFVSQDNSEVVTPVRTTTSLDQKETISVHAGIKETTPVKGCKYMCSIEGREGKKVASPKDPPSWVKHKIYNTWSKVSADKYQVSTGGL